MTTMSGAESLAAILESQGVEVVFGLPGVQIMDAVDAIYRSGKIRWISTRHEQTAAYMAYGYARSTGKIGVTMVLPGPGALNTAAAVGTAYTASTPLLIISGQIESRHLGHHHGVLHELDDQVEIFRYLTRWSGRAATAADIPATVSEAFRQLKSGRPRPVEIEVPFDLWSKPIEFTPSEIGAEPPLKPKNSDIKKAATILRKAEKPLILAGGGAAKSGISREIEELAELINAPVVMTTEGQGVLGVNHRLYAGSFLLWSNPAFAMADAVLIVGSRLRASGNTSLKLRPDQRVIQIDFEPEELGRNHRIDLGITADARTAICALVKELEGGGVSRWQDIEVTEIRREVNARLEKAAPFQMSILKTIREVLPDDAILVPDITNLGYWSEIGYPACQPRTYIESSYFATLGFAFPTALGAKIGNPDKPVVVICGDGGFPYAMAELATAVQEEINVIVLLFTDNAYGTVTGIQKRQFGGRYVGNRLHNPDYVKLTESFGAIGIRLEAPEKLGENLKSTLDLKRPAVIEIPVPLLDTPWNANI